MKQAVADRQEAILGAALELFAERGFHGTAVPEIAERAGVGAGTIYRYFESKEAIVNVLLQRWKIALGAALVDGFPFDASPRAQIHHFVTRTIEFAKKHPMALKFLEAHHHQPYLDAKSRAVEEQVLEPAKTFFEHQERTKATRKVSPEVLFAVAWGSLYTLIRFHWEGRAELSPRNIEALEECIWDAIRRPEK